MTSANITVAGASAVATMNGVLTTGMVGAKAVFSFDEDWNGLSKIAVFRAGSVAKAVPLTDNEAVIPWEVLLTPYVNLYAGVCGTRGKDIVIPTVWAKCDTIQPGTDPEVDPGLEPTLPVWAQMERRLEKLEEQQPEGGNGDIDPDAVKEHEWRLLKKLTLSEEVTSITIDTDSDGQPFAVKELLYQLYGTAGHDANGEGYTANQSYSVYPNPVNAGALRTTIGNGLYKTGLTVRSYGQYEIVSAGRYMEKFFCNGGTVTNDFAVYGNAKTITALNLYTSASFGIGCELYVYGR